MKSALIGSYNIYERGAILLPFFKVTNCDLEGHPSGRGYPLYALRTAGAESRGARRDPRQIHCGPQCRAKALKDAKNPAPAPNRLKTKFDGLKAEAAGSVQQGPQAQPQPAPAEETK
jgi:hypothetical protein